MPQRKTVQDYRSLARKRRFHWLGPEVPNVKTKTEWRCKQGHQWSGCYADIRSGCGCPICGKISTAEKLKLNVSAYHELAAKRGFQWLGPEVANANTKTSWKCAAGHIFESRYGNIQTGYGCPYCAGLARKTSADYHELARTHGYKLVGHAARNTNTKSRWECSEGHQWEATYNTIDQGSGCPYCSGVAKKTVADYRALAAQRGFVWLGPVVGNNRTKTRWRCPNGHEWNAVFSTIQRGSGCKICQSAKTAATQRHSPLDYHELASQRGFRWLGPEVTGALIKTRWECSKGHQWNAVYASIQQGSGCPTCVDMINGVPVSRAQRRLCKMLDGELNFPCGHFRIDIAIERSGLQIAVEYDSWFWHGWKADEDEKRDQELRNSGWRILRIRSNAKLPKLDDLNEAIGRLVAGEQAVEIVLGDWGKGRTRFPVPENENVMNR